MQRAPRKLVLRRSSPKGLMALSFIALEAPTGKKGLQQFMAYFCTCRLLRVLTEWRIFALAINIQAATSRTILL